MPIYEYRCPDCGEQFEEWQKMADPPVTVCPKCSEQNVTKLISAPAFHLKGGGWYSDHYGLKSDSGSDASSDSGAKASGDAATPAAPAAASKASADTPAAAPAAAPTPAPSSDT